MKTLFNDGSTVPTAFVTKGRQRVKQYGDTVYLNNGEEFEIELFNPTTTKILAKIELNGISLGSGIVLRPGERVFLERYLNESKKFLFETYEVDGNNPNVQKAIINNGKVDVKFYVESTPLNYYWNDSWSYTSWTPPNNPTYTTGGFGGQSGDMSFGTFNTSSSSDTVHCFACLSEPVKNIETGRIEKGSNSKQSFVNDNTSFNSWFTWNSIWKILPMSRKPLEYKDLKVFCTNCGAKQKRKSFIFCPHCGQKF